MKNSRNSSHISHIFLHTWQKSGLKLYKENNVHGIFMAFHDFQQFDELDQRPHYRQNGTYSFTPIDTTQHRSIQNRVKSQTK